MTNLPRIRGMVAYGTPAETAQYYDLNFASVGVSTETGTAYTFRPTDSGGWVRFTSSSPVTATIAPFSSIELPFGAVIMVEQAGTGLVTIAAGAGVTVYGVSSVPGQYSVLRLVNLARNVWSVTDGEGVGSSSTTLYASRSSAALADIGPTVDAIQTAGFAAAGDGGGAVYYRTSGSTAGGFQSFDGAWWALPDGAAINVRQFGAVGNGVIDDTAAIQLAIEAMKAEVYTYTGGGWNSNMSTAVLLFPGGAYLVEGSLDLQNIQNGAWTLSGYGAVVYATCAGKTVFDLLGSRFFRIEGIQLVGDSVDSPAIGFQPGRHSASGSYSYSSQFNFTDVGTDGVFTRCALYSLGCETDTYINCRFWNFKTGSEGAAVIIDGYNLSMYGAITDFIPTTLPVDTAVSCGMHTFIGGSVYARTGSPFITCEAHNTKALNLYVVSFDSAGYRIISIGGAVYDIEWDVHTEAAGLTSTIEVVRLTSGTVTFILTIRDVTASSTATALLARGTNVISISVTEGHADFGTNFAASVAPPFDTNVAWNGSIQGVPNSWTVSGDASLDIGAVTRGNAKWHIETGTVFTASRIFTLPKLTNLVLGSFKTITDAVGAISPQFPLIVAPNNVGETINGKPTWRKHNLGGDVTFYGNSLASRWSAPPETGKAYTTANFDKVNATLAAVTGLTFTVGTGKTYRFVAALFCTVDAAGGSKVSIGGSATATTIEYSIKAFNMSTIALLYGSLETAIGGSESGAGGTIHKIEIEGTIVVNAAGTLGPQFAQHTATGTSTVLPMSTFQIDEIL